MRNVNLAVAIGIMSIRVQESVTILSQRQKVSHGKVRNKG